MSRSNWLPVTALVGLALQPVGNCSYAQTGAANSKQQPQQTPQIVAPLDLAPLNERLERIDKSIEALQPKPETADENRRAEGDLKAQQDMAWWAKWMTIATGLSVFVSALGVGLIVLTLRQNKRAMRIALAGAKSASRSVRVAKQAADASSALERGYVFVKPEYNIGLRSPRPGALIDESLPYFSASSEIRNYGRTPIILRTFESAVDLLSKPSEPDNTLPMPVILFPGGRVLEAGQKWNSSSASTTPITGSDWRITVDEGVAFVWYYGKVTYEDVLGNIRFTRFRWQYNGLAKSFEPYGGKPFNERT
jgi:hypothetical protein